MARLLEICTWANVVFVNVEPPVRRSRHPWKFSWTEFKFASVEVEPVDVLINKLSRKIAKEFRSRNEL